MRLLTVAALVLPAVLAVDCADSQQYNIIPAFNGTTGCLPSGFYQAQDLGNTVPDDLVLRCSTLCSQSSSCEAFFGQLWQAGDSGAYTGQCYFFSVPPVAPAPCVDHPTIILAQQKDYSLQCLSSDAAAATSYCSSLLSIPVVTVYTSTFTPVTRETSVTSKTISTTTKTSTTSTIQTTLVKTQLTRTTSTSVTTSTKTKPSTTKLTSTTTTTATFVPSQLPAKKRTADAPVAIPSCLSSTPSERVSSACSCLSVNPSTRYLVSTAPLETSTVYKTSKVSTTTTTSTISKSQTSKTTTTSFTTSTIVKVDKTTTTFTSVSTISSIATATASVYVCDPANNYGRYYSGANFFDSTHSPVNGGASVSIDATLANDPRGCCLSCLQTNSCFFWRVDTTSCAKFTINVISGGPISNICPNGPMFLETNTGTIWGVGPCAVVTGPMPTIS